MSGNSFGTLLKVTTFGESHGKAMGVVIDGLPSRLKINEENLGKWLARRAPGQKGTTDRKESDIPEILSGTFEGQTLGTPLAVIIKNTNQKSEDYEWAKKTHRLGHGDLTYQKKYGIRDHRGGGRASGRETVSRVVAGYFASLVVPEIQVKASILTVGGKRFSTEQSMVQYLEGLKKSGDSCGAAIQVSVRGAQAGLGEPVFGKLKSRLADAMLSIGGCTSFGYGAGALFADQLGSENRDKNLFGGIEGGISNGEDLSFHLSFKAPSTVGEKAKQGRHDPCLVPRVLPVVEAMTYLVLADLKLLQQRHS